MKKYLKLSLAIALLNNAYANVIELDTQDEQNCQVQLAQAQINMPVILEYMEHCKFYDQFLPIYQKVADEHPNLTFYKVNTEKLNDAVRDSCLGHGSAYGDVSPKVTVNFFINTSPPRIYQLRSDVGSLTTPFSKEELDYLIRGLEPRVLPGMGTYSLPWHSINVN